MKCEKEYCEVCRKNVKCQWLHNITVHNMPINWQTDRTPFEMKKHKSCLNGEKKLKKIL